MKYHKSKSLSITLLVAASAVLSAAVQKPVIDRPIRTEDRGGVGSVHELWGVSDVIVEGVIGDDRPADYGRAPVRVNKMFDFRITEVFKGNRSVGPNTTIHVRRTGGKRDEGDKIANYIQDGYPMFQRGDRYILFLKQYEWVSPAPYSGIYYADATKTADSAFRVGPDSKITGGGKTVLSESIRVTPVGVLRSNLRALGGAK